MTKNLALQIPSYLCGDGYAMVDAEPFGREQEREYVEVMMAVRNEVNSVKLCAGECPSCGKKIYASLLELISKKLCKSCDEPVQFKISKSNQKLVARYENERHTFALLFSHIVQKAAGIHLSQCQSGMGFDDLCQVGFVGLMNVVDKWPPFLGAEDKNFRILTSMQRSVSNAIRRFLDDNGRTIKLPTYKIEQTAVRIRAENVIYGKRGKNGDCKEKQCKACENCQNLHSKACRRNKPTKFELAIQEMIKEVYEVGGTDIEQKAEMSALLYENLDNRSLADFATETGRYKEVAKVVNLEVETVLSIINPTVSIDVPLNDGTETVADMVEGEEYDFEHSVYTRIVLEEALDCLTADNHKRGMKNPERSANILRDSYFNNLSIREIAQKNGFSTERANELIKKSRNRLQGCKTAMNILQHKLIG